MKFVNYIIIVALYIFLNTGMVFADLTIERKVTLSITDVINRKDRINRKEALKIHDNNVKIDDKTFGITLIIRGDKKLVWQINTLNGTYAETSFADILKQKYAVINEIKSAKTTVGGSEEEKVLNKIIIDLGEVPPSAKVEIKENAESEEILGYKCKRKTVLLDDRIIIDGYFAEDVDGGTDYLKTLVMANSLPIALEGKLSQLKGTMLKGDIRYTLFTDRITATETILSMSKEDIKPEEFDLPNGLNKVAPDDFEGAMPTK